MPLFLCLFTFWTGEVTMPSERQFDSEVHLCLGDIRVDSHEKPSMLQVVIKCSKTDPLQAGGQLIHWGNQHRIVPGDGNN